MNIDFEFEKARSLVNCHVDTIIRFIDSRFEEKYELLQYKYRTQPLRRLVSDTIKVRDDIYSVLYSIQGVTKVVLSDDIPNLLLITVFSSYKGLLMEETAYDCARILKERLPEGVNVELKVLEYNYEKIKSEATKMLPK
jgi:hypothetical protein